MKRQRFWESVSCILYFWGNYPIPLIILVLLFSSYQSWLKLGLKFHSTYMFLRAKSLQSCSILCDTMDCSLPGSSVLGILQTTMLEWVAFSSSRGSSQPRDRTHIFYISYTGRWVLYHWCHGFNPCSGNRSRKPCGTAKKKKNKIIYTKFG